MPANPATVTVSVQSAQPREDSEGLPLIIGYDSIDSDVNVFKDYFDSVTLKAIHGKTSKTGISGNTHFDQRAERVVVVKPTVSAVVAEALGTPAAGTLANFPISNLTPPVFEQDSAARTVVATDEDPITSVPAAGTVLVNFSTGDYKFPAVASTDATVDYVYHDYTALLNSYKTSKPTLGPVTFVTVPALQGTLAALGDIKALATIAETMFWFLIVQTPTTTTVAQDKALREAIDSSHVMLVKSKDATIDLAAAIAGIGSRTEPFRTLAFKEIRRIDTDYFLDTDIGDVETADTFEGEGVNVVHRIGGKDVLANERTAVVYAGSVLDNKDEIYASRVLAKIALKNRIEIAINNLLVREGMNVTNSVSGVGSVHTEIVKVMENAVSDSEVRKDYFVGDPPDLGGASGFAASVSDAKRRRLGPWSVSGKMIESAHEVVVNAFLEVA